MNVLGLDQVSSTATQTSESKNSVMGKDDFLNLLVTQLQNQDPLNPADSTEFTAQLATFSSLEELQNIDSSLQGVSTSQSVLTNSQAVNYIGRQIQAVGDHIAVDNGKADPIQFNLSQDAAGAYIKVYNQYGDFIRNIELGALGSGDQSVNWDGLDANGQQAPDGSYRYEVMAMDADGNSVDATTFTSGTVSGVYYKNGLAYLVTGDQEIPLGSVVQVNAPNSSLPADQ
jgi:flagellar basal-body rod modification protein FlgD